MDFSILTLFLFLLVAAAALSPSFACYAAGLPAHLLRVAAAAPLRCCCCSRWASCCRCSTCCAAPPLEPLGCCRCSNCCVALLLLLVPLRCVAAGAAPAQAAAGEEKV